MALTPQEQLELEQINAEIAKQEQAPLPKSGLTESEQLELRQIEEEIAKQEGFDADAALAGFGQGATLGYLPQISAGAQKLVQPRGVGFSGTELQGKTPEETQKNLEEAVSNPVNILAQQSNLSSAQIDELLKRTGFKLVPDETYIQLRDEESRRLQDLQQKSPKSFGAGQIAGGLTTGIATSGALPAPAAGASRLVNVGKAATTGGIYGFLSNPGDIEGVTDPLQIRDRLENGLQMAATGGGLQAAGQAISSLAKAIKNSPATVKALAELKATKAFGAISKHMKKFGNKGRINELGREALDNNLVQAGDTIEDISKKAIVLKEDIGNKIGSIYSDADEAITGLDLTQLTPNQVKRIESSALNMEKFKNRIMKKVRQSYTGSGSKDANNTARNILSEISDLGDDLSLADLNAEKTKIGKLIKWQKSTQEMPIKQQVTADIYNEINEALRARVGTVNKITGAGSNKVRELMNLNKKYQNLSEIVDTSADALSKAKGNRTAGLSESIGTGTGAVVGTILGGYPGAIVGSAVGGLTTNIIRKYANPVVADIANKAASALAKNPQAIGRFSDTLILAAEKSPQAFVKAIQGLKNDPEFKKEMGAINE